MTEIKMTVAMLCAYKGWSNEKLADEAKIDRNHLNAVRNNRATMTADDLIGLSDATGIDVRMIATKQN